MTSSTISPNPKLTIPNYDIQELMEPVSANSDNSGHSDTEISEISGSDDLNYQETISTSNNSSRSTQTALSPTSHKPAAKFIVPPPPPRLLTFLVILPGIMILQNPLSIAMSKRLYHQMQRIVRMVLFLKCS